MNDCSAPPSTTGPSAAAPQKPNEPEPIGSGNVSTQDQKLQFLYKALDDNQSVIRFLDAKAAFAAALLSAMTGKFLADLPSYLPLAGQPIWRRSLLFGFCGFGILTGFILFRVIFPVTNPAQNVKLISSDCSPHFFIWEMKPRSWLRIWSRAPRFSTVVLDQMSFLDELKTATYDSLLKCMTGEVLKVSYIRQIKADRLRTLALLLFVTSVSFILFVATPNTSQKTNDAQKVRVEGIVEVHDKSKDRTVAPSTQSTAAPRPKGHRGPAIKP